MSYDWTGCFHNIERGKGYTLEPIKDREGWYHFRLSPCTPLQYICDNGDMWEPDRSFDTDLASIPWYLQTFDTPEDFELESLFHDPACIFRGLFRQRPGETEFRFVKLDRLARDRMFRRMAECRGKAYARCLLAYGCIRFWAIITFQSR